MQFLLGTFSYILTGTADEKTQGIGHSITDPRLLYNCRTCHDLEVFQVYGNIPFP
jgi:hypothetical protein